jgi:hypothetical protein
MRCGRGDDARDDEEKGEEGGDGGSAAVEDWLGEHVVSGCPGARLGARLRCVSAIG